MPCHKDDDSVESWAEYDTKGLYLCRVCNECQVDSLKRFKPEILDDDQLKLIGIDPAAVTLRYDEVVEEPIDEG